MEIKPCPFCGIAMKERAAMNGKPNGHAHPTNGCLLAGWFFGIANEAKWQARAASVGMVVIDGHPQFFEDRGERVGPDMLNKIVEFYRNG